VRAGQVRCFFQADIDASHKEAKYFTGARRMALAALLLLAC
jgi:hypothetical protein